MTFHFKVGDVVKFSTAGLEADIVGWIQDHGERFTVIEVGHRLNGQQWMNYLVKSKDGDTLYVRSKWITMCTTCNGAVDEAATKPYAHESKAKAVAYAAEKSKPMGVLTTLRDLARTPEDRLFRKYGVVDECGDITSQGEDLLVEILFAQNKAEIVEKLKAVEAEEKKNKKS